MIAPSEALPPSNTRIGLWIVGVCIAVVALCAAVVGAPLYFSKGSDASTAEGRRAGRDLAKLRESSEHLRDRVGTIALVDVARLTADARDPWGHPYTVRSAFGGIEIVCLGADGVLATDDDLSVFVAAKRDSK